MFTSTMIIYSRNPPKCRGVYFSPKFWQKMCQKSCHFQNPPLNLVFDCPVFLDVNIQKVTSKQSFPDSKFDIWVLTSKKIVKREANESLQKSVSRSRSEGRRSNDRYSDGRRDDDRYGGCSHYNDRYGDRRRNDRFGDSRRRADRYDDRSRRYNVRPYDRRSSGRFYNRSRTPPRTRWVEPAINPMVRPPRPNENRCNNFWTRGQCNFGRNCRFMH